MNRLTTINRRSFLGAGTVAIAAACGGSRAQSDNAAPTKDPLEDAFQDDGSRFLQAIFADGNVAPTTLAAGQIERAPFSIRDGTGKTLVNGAPEAVEGVLTTPSGTASDVVLPKFDDGLAAPHYSLRFDAAESGFYELAAAIDGQTQGLLFEVAEPVNTELVQVGEPLRSVDTPTFDDARGFDPICTRFEPCPFHVQSLADVIGNERPTAFIIATPGFCRTVSCGPVVDLLIDLDPNTTVDVVHSEVYTEPARINDIGFAPELLGPAVSTYAMVFEPSFIVAGADDIVTARLDYAFDRAEMAEALATAL